MFSGCLAVIFQGVSRGFRWFSGPLVEASGGVSKNLHVTSEVHIAGDFIAFQGVSGSSMGSKFGGV